MAWQIALQWSVITRAQPPGADPHAGWCGRGSGKPDPYPDLSLLAGAIKGVSDGLEQGQWQIRKKIFEFDFCAVYRQGCWIF